MAHFDTVVIDGKLRVVDFCKNMFYKNYILGSSYYECPYANLERISDITIADAWGDREHSYFNDDRGGSLVIVNTSKGNELFETGRRDTEVVPVEISNFLQPNLREPSKRPITRDEFCNDYFSYGFEHVSKLYGMNNINGKAICTMKRILGVTGTTRIIKK